MDSARRLIEADRFAQFTGVELVEMGEGHAVARLQVQDHHMNGLGIVHGGVIFALADLVFEAASNSRGQVAVALNANINFARAGTSGILTAEAQERTFNPRIASYGIEVKDEAGETLATFEGIVYRKRETTAEAAERLGLT